ncbi:hypothetical protein [Congregibacter litoralis]|nr:hypothetical protein [Congregibacter litoralis]
MSAMLAVLSACGGGGGSGGGGGFLPGDGDSDLTSYTITLTTVDASGNPTTEVSETFPVTLRVEVKEDTFDAPAVSGLVVLATADFAVVSPANGQALTNSEGIAELEIQAGPTLGADTITVTAESPAETVTATIGIEITRTGLTLGHFSGTSFIANQIGLSNTDLAFRGTAEVRLAVVDEEGQAVTGIQQIRLSSACSLSGQARFRPLGDTSDGTTTLTVETTDGLAQAEYVSGSCEAGDELSAELIGGDSSASGTVTIASRDANYIGFFSSDPSEGQEGTDRTILALRGTGGPGRPEVATVTFEVLESAVVLATGDPQPGEPGYIDLDGRAPLSGINVNFELTNELGGVTLLNSSAVTDSQGLAVVEVLAGSVPSSTLVIASFEAQLESGASAPQSATSNQIVVSTGIADQNSLSLKAEEYYVPYAADVDGISVVITAQVADKFNNPVPDGTSAVFTTEYGDIDASCLTGESNGARYQSLIDTSPPPRGTCRVLWVSQNPRFPTLNASALQTIEDDGSYSCASFIGVDGPCPDDLGAGRGLRSTVSVTVLGEEFFVDANGNGQYDEFESFENLPEAFNDHNEDGVYTPELGPNCPPPSTSENCAAAGAEEEFVDLNGDGIYSLNVDPSTGEGVYNGSLCPESGDGVFCSRSLVNTRRDLVLTLTSRAFNLFVGIVDATPPASQDDSFSEGNQYRLYISDLYNNSPAAGVSSPNTPAANGTIIELSALGDCQFTEFTDGYVSGSQASVTVTEKNGEVGAFEMSLAVTGEPTGQGGQVVVTAQGPGIKARDAANATPPQPAATTRQEEVEIARFPCRVFVGDNDLVPGG